MVRYLENSKLETDQFGFKDYNPHRQLGAALSIMKWLLENPKKNSYERIAAKIWLLQVDPFIITSKNRLTMEDFI